MMNDVGQHLPQPVKNRDLEPFSGGFFTRFYPKEYELLLLMGNDISDFIREAVTEKFNQSAELRPGEIFVKLRIFKGRKQNGVYLWRGDRKETHFGRQRKSSRTPWYESESQLINAYPDYEEAIVMDIGQLDF